jgi:hypothetical protein
MEKYEQLKKVIQEANPEIMESKFGCKIETKIGEFISKHGRADNILACTVIDVTDDGFLTTSTYDRARIAKKSEITKILGRPIRLADVLLAASKVFSPEEYKKRDDTFLGVVLRWNPKDDNLDHPSDETKQFMIDLLVK